MGIGAYHVGVEVLGDEWYFRWSETAESGIVWMRPRAHQVHVYSESICLGTSELSDQQIRSVLGGFVDGWPARSYHPVNRNCIHFAQAFVEALRCSQPFPEWVLGLPDAVQSTYLASIANSSWELLRWWNAPGSCSSCRESWLEPYDIEEVTQTTEV